MQIALNKWKICYNVRSSTYVHSTHVCMRYVYLSNVLIHFVYPATSIVCHPFYNIDFYCTCMSLHLSTAVAIVPTATQDFKDDFGHSDDYSLSDVLWTCSSMLSNRYQSRQPWSCRYRS